MQFQRSGISHLSTSHLSNSYSTDVQLMLQWSLTLTVPSMDHLQPTELSSHFGEVGDEPLPFLHWPSSIDYS